MRLKNFTILMAPPPKKKKDGSPHLQRTSKFFRHLGPDISAVPPKSSATALRMAPLAVELPAELGKGKDRLQKIDFLRSWLHQP